MQLFEFSKKLLLQLKKQRDAKIATSGDTTATGRTPVRLILQAEPSYEREGSQPLKELEFTISGQNQPTQSFLLTIPESNLLRNEKDIAAWLEGVFEFIANSHGMALERSIKKTGGKTAAKAFINPSDWETRIVQTGGKLSELPLETAIQTMDKLEKLTLANWRPSSKDARLSVKTFATHADGEHAKELLHLILLTNGYDEKSLRTDLRMAYDPSTQRCQLRLPARYLREAVQAERFVG